MLDGLRFALKLVESESPFSGVLCCQDYVRLFYEDEEKEKIMDFGLTDEQQLLVESLKEYADRYFDDESVRQMYENHQVSAEAQRNRPMQADWC